MNLSAELEQGRDIFMIWLGGFMDNIQLIKQHKNVTAPEPESSVSHNRNRSIIFSSVQYLFSQSYFR